MRTEIRLLNDWKQWGRQCRLLTTYLLSKTKQYQGSLDRWCRRHQMSVAMPSSLTLVEGSGFAEPSDWCLPYGSRSMITFDRDNYLSLTS